MVVVARTIQLAKAFTDGPWFAQIGWKVEDPKVIAVESLTTAIESCTSASYANAVAIAHSHLQLSFEERRPRDYPDFDEVVTDVISLLDPELSALLSDLVATYKLPERGPRCRLGDIPPWLS